MSDEFAVRKMIDKIQAKLGPDRYPYQQRRQGDALPTGIYRIREYRKLWDLNVLGPLIAMQAAIPVMRKQGGGTNS